MKIIAGQPKASPKVLVAPLDWGLGHATRCVPIVGELLRQGAEVLLAGEGGAKALLQQEFPQLHFIELPGYRIEYSSSAWGLAAKIVAQIPKLLSAIKEEQEWLQKVVEKEGIDAVISDNRYGLYHPAVHSIFVTHQLRIKVPLALAEDLLQGLNYDYIQKFDECWVPDAEGETNLAGSLSHPTEMPSVPVRYTGPLSRFSSATVETTSEYPLLLLSGPEPQRTLLENIFLKELENYRKPVVLVRGLPTETGPLTVPLNVSVFNHLPAAELEQTIGKASLVIARSGYSTVMDLAALKKRSVLIPTPGQTEQEYLAEHLMKMNLALCLEQKKFRLRSALALAESFAYKPFGTPHSDLQACISSLIGKVAKRKDLST